MQVLCWQMVTAAPAAEAEQACWQSLPDSTAQQLLVRLVMLIERRTALFEVLPWLWPLADEDSGCKVNVKPKCRSALLSALIAIPEAMGDALGGKGDAVHATCLLWHNQDCL